MKFYKLLALVLCLAMLLATAVACKDTQPEDDTQDADQGDVTGDQTGDPNQDQTEDSTKEDEPDQTPEEDEKEEDPEQTTEDKTEEKPEEKPAEPTDLSLCDASWTSASDEAATTVVEGVSIANGAYSFDRALAVKTGAGTTQEMVYTIEGQGYYTFTSLVGVQDGCTGGAVEYFLYVEDMLQQRTGTMRAGEYMYLSTGIRDKATIKLVVVGAQDNADQTVALWGNATLHASRRTTAPLPSMAMTVDYYIDEIDWISASSLHDVEKGAPFVNQNESGGMISMGSGLFMSQKGVWMHPKFGEEGYAEIVLDLTTRKPSTFCATFGLSDEYVGAKDGYVGEDDPSLRSVQFVFLLDGVEVASHEFINSVKLGTIILDTSAASQLTIRLTSYDGVHTCDAAVITAGFVQ